MTTQVLQSDEDNSKTIPANPFDKDTKSGAEDRNHIDGPKIPLTELFSLVRHSKLSLLKEALDYLPSKSFDKSLVQVIWYLLIVFIISLFIYLQASYVVDHGTVYVDGYERLPFHINKTDEHGNTMLTLACQNGNMKICKYLQAKGANLNHQNVNGQTPAHFAIAYKFFEVSHWLFENGGDDTLENKYGLSPYDGLSADGGDESLLAIEN